MASRSFVIQDRTADNLDIKNHLEIKGYREAGETLQFVLESYNKQITYTLDFGNGIQKNMNGKTLSYAFPREGKYNIKLLASYKNETKEMVSDMIHIQDAILVVQGALIER